LGDQFSPELKELMIGLLNPAPEKRIHTFKNSEKHSWFKHVDWKSVRQRMAEELKVKEAVRLRSWDVATQRRLRHTWHGKKASYEFQPPVFEALYLSMKEKYKQMEKIQSCGNFFSPNGP